MKAIHTITLAAMLAVATAATAQTRDDDGIVASPKFRAFLDSQKRLPVATEDKLDRSVKQMSPKAQQFAESLRRTPASSDGVDLAHPKGIVLMGKHTITNSDYQVAPLK